MPALLVLALLTLGLVSPSADHAEPGAAGRPWVSVLGTGSVDPAALREQGVDRVVLGVGWDVLEPVRGTVDPAAAERVRTRLAALRLAGLQVVLDPGLQYPPAWVFTLPGQTRFVDQDGHEWHGRLSEDVPNAVFNPAVRDAEADYLARLAGVVGPGDVVAVRVGGLLSGELRYPVSSFDGSTGSLWGFDDAAQAGAPLPGWKPGRGTTEDARRWLQYYFDSLTGYQDWLLGRTAAGWPGTELQVLLPSFGLRPGMADAAAAAGLRGTTAPERNDLVSQGLDWEGQVAAMAATGLPVVVCTTWLDGPERGTTDTAASPGRYLARLTADAGLPLAGENTGGGGAAALATSTDRVAELGMTGLTWFSGDDLASRRDGLDPAGFGAGLRAGGLAR
ncbi:hypothetical protein GCM10027047_20280 [Rhodococcus aerolatus]